MWWTRLRPATAPRYLREHARKDLPDVLDATAAGAVPAASCYPQGVHRRSAPSTAAPGRAALAFYVKVALFMGRL